MQKPKRVRVKGFKFLQRSCLMLIAVFSLLLNACFLKVDNSDVSSTPSPGEGEGDRTNAGGGGSSGSGNNGSDENSIALATVYSVNSGGIVVDKSVTTGLVISASIGDPVGGTIQTQGELKLHSGIQGVLVNP